MPYFILAEARELLKRPVPAYAPAPVFVWFGKKFALSNSRWARGRHGQHLQEG